MNDVFSFIYNFIFYKLYKNIWIYHARLCELKVSDGASFPELWSLVQSNSMLYTHREASLYKLLNRYQAKHGHHWQTDINISLWWFNFKWTLPNRDVIQSLKPHSGAEKKTSTGISCIWSVNANACWCVPGNIPDCLHTCQSSNETDQHFHVNPCSLVIHQI